MPSVNRSRLRSSGIRKMFAIALMMNSPVGGSGLCLGLALGFDQLRLAARLLDLGLGALAERVRAHGQRLVDLALPEHLDRIEAAADQACLQQLVRVDDRARAEALEAADVDDRDLLGERVEEAALGQAAPQRRLA